MHEPGLKCTAVSPSIIQEVFATAALEPWQLLIPEVFTKLSEGFRRCQLLDAGLHTPHKDRCDACCCMLLALAGHSLSMLQ